MLSRRIFVSAASPGSLPKSWFPPGLPPMMTTVLCAHFIAPVWDTERKTLSAE